MGVGLGIRAVELLCSRLCHDLVGPVGAINNGVELLDDGGVKDEALDLIADSAENAAARLRLYRLALGAAGGQSALSPADGRAALEGWFRAGKIRLDWTAQLHQPAPGLVKLAMLAALMAEETLPRGGQVRVEGGDGALAVIATGVGAALRPEMAAALSGPVEEADLTPRSILSFAVPRIAAAYGLDFTCQVTADIRFLCRRPGG